MMSTLSLAPVSKRPVPSPDPDASITACDPDCGSPDEETRLHALEDLRSLDDMEREEIEKKRSLDLDV